MLNIEKHITAHNFTAGRGGFKVAEITIHHAAGTGPLSIMKEAFHDPSRKGSAHYGVRNDEIYQFVEESDTAWTNSNGAANRRAVTIEVVNSSGSPDWRVNITTFETLVNLVYNIAERHKLLPLIKGQSLTWHSMYAATICPGPWLLDHMNDLLGRVNVMYQDCESYLKGLVVGNPEFVYNTIYRVRHKDGDPATQVGAYSSFENAFAHCATLNGLDGPNGMFAIFNQDGLKVYPKGK